MITVLIFIIVLSILVFVHELGHFWTARKLGVKAEEFGFGFPPRAFGIYKDKSGKWRFLRSKKDPSTFPEDQQPAGTVYSINWLPLGGFVKIKGQDGDEKQDSDSFASKSVWKRALILSAGVIMNIILAAALLSVGYMVGFPHQSTDSLRPSARVSNSHIFVTQVMPNSPASQAGLQAGDIILSIDGQILSNEEEVTSIISAREGLETEFLIQRNNSEQILLLEPSILEGMERAVVGIGFSSLATVSYPFFTAILEGFKKTFLLLWLILLAIFELIKNWVSGASVSEEMAGPIGIAMYTGQVASMGFTYLMQFVALLSLNLALINILPFPALDGGRLLFLLIEKFKGRPVKQSLEATIHTIGFSLLIILIILVTYKDIQRWFF